jgi:hypothetical protein
MSQSAAGGRIEPDDIKAKLADIQGEATQTVEGAKSQLLAVGAGIAIVALLVAFLLGRRAGRRASAVIEVRRS